MWRWWCWYWWRDWCKRNQWMPSLYPWITQTEDTSKGRWRSWKESDINVISGKLENVWIEELQHGGRQKHYSKTSALSLAKRKRENIFHSWAKRPEDKWVHLFPLREAFSLLFSTTEWSVFLFITLGDWGGGVKEEDVFKLRGYCVCVCMCAFVGLCAYTVSGGKSTPLN